MFNFKFGTLNARGLASKIDSINDIMIQNDLDFVFITETWWNAQRRPGRSFTHNLGPQEGMSGHPPYGTAIMWNPTKEVRFPLEIIHSGEEGKIQVFRWGGIFFVGCHIPPGEEIDEKWHRILVGWIGKARPGEPIIILGDLNMRLGHHTGDRVSNARAKWLYPLLLSNELVFANNDLSFLDRATCVSGVGPGSIVDYIFYSRERLQLGEFSVSQEDVGSDHLLIWAAFEARHKPEPSQKYRSWNITKLKEEEVIERYREHFKETSEPTFERWCNRPCSSQEDVDSIYKVITGLVEDTAREIIGTSDRTKWRIPLIHPLLPGLRDMCKHLRKACQLGGVGADITFNELKKMRTEAHEMAKESLEMNWKSFVERADSLDSTELMKLTKSFKAARSQCRSTQLETSEEALERYSRHYERQFSPPENAIPYTRTSIEPDPSECHIFATPGVVEKIILEYPNGKSGGPSGQKMELFKPIADMIAHPLSRFFNNMIKSGIVPTDWCRAHIIPIPKKPNSAMINEHRPVSLTEVLRKVFERCLLFPLINSIGHAHFAQGGFEARKGTIDQVAALNETFIISRKRLKRNPCVAFLDIKAAYDSTDRNVLSNRLLELGCPRYLIRVIMALFDNNKSRVVVAGRISPLISHAAGLLQGSILSPTLYNCYIGGIMKRLIEANGNDPLTSFWYADDSAIVAKDPGHLQQLLDVAVRHSEEINFRFNPAKCEVMNCSSAPITIYGDPVPTCSRFKYLGVWFDENGADWRSHFDKMIEKARKVIGFWRGVGFNNRGFKLRTRRLIYTTFIRPVVEYGLAISPELKFITSKLEKVQGEALCALFGTYKCSSRNAMETLLNITNFEYRRQELRARWIMRMRDRGEDQMTWHCLNQNRGRKLIRRSSFTKTDMNQIVIYHDQKEREERENHEAAAVRKPYKARKIDKSIIELRFLELGRMRELTKHCGFVPIYEDCKARWIYALSRSELFVGSYICKWMIGRYVGAPTKCLICKEEGCHNSHLMMCGGIGNIDKMAGEKKWLQAVMEIWRLFSVAESLEQLVPRRQMSRLTLLEEY
jgi:hypothetical protein